MMVTDDSGLFVRLSKSLLRPLSGRFALANIARYAGLASILVLAGCNVAPGPVPITGGSLDQNVELPSGRFLVNSEAIRNSLDVPITKLDGTKFSLSEHRGKVVVVDFWATFCPPCVKQAPQLAELSGRYRDQGLEVVGLTSDDKSDQKKVEEFIQRVGINYNIGYAGNWVSHSFLAGTEDETGAPPIPQLFIISRRGEVVEHLIGDSPQRGVARLEEVIKRELALK